MVSTGLERLFDNLDSLQGKRVGVACNHTAVDPNLDHLLDRLRAAGIVVRRIFAPEHGLHATAQDMISVDGEDDGPAVVSLYGSSAATLRPAPELLADLDVVLFDIQDIGSRYYTYQATLGYMMEVAATTGTRIVVLDRPNPIDGVTLEGNVVEPGFESFVSAYPLAVRHGMTMGELALLFNGELSLQADLRVVPVRGWKRAQWFDETKLPWVRPSPNLPSLKSMLMFPGTVMFEGTNLSVGRGTGEPFQRVGAPWLKSREVVDLLRERLLPGVKFEAERFTPNNPTDHKHPGVTVPGVRIIVTDRDAVSPTRVGAALLWAIAKTSGDSLTFRQPRFDELFGSTAAREAILRGDDPDSVLDQQLPLVLAWRDRMKRYQLYR